MNGCYRAKNECIIYQAFTIFTSKNTKYYSTY